MRPVILALLLFSSCAVAGQSPRVLSPEAFEKAISEGDQLILDVRTEKEFRLGYIKNAMQANWNDTAEFRKRVQAIDRQKPVYIYCLGGVRSTAAAKWMETQGFSNLIELDGGINAWKIEARPLENPVQEKQLTLLDLSAMVGTNTTVLVDFGADWCPPCRKMQPVLDSLKKDGSIRFELIKIDAGTQTEIQKSLGIKTLPTFIIFKNGKDTWRGEGIIEAAELKKRLE
ncbi:thioredoxin domain-containing protein [Terrimonas sp. NA20]|uniref:Thioredoxin domain-containing protein n=1 Tax=Terrimonas ginsenosidimutans TaxID=2908004 RepID=A0ABS9KXI5_9BACT|nr:thioredoxin domain-containing protein [Terrimonas ginsenosidimutans]MCG2617030.1 thioredoxin domain-containing protein [Terrimonas ginsenosidimutans]